MGFYFIGLKLYLFTYAAMQLCYDIRIYLYINLYFLNWQKILLMADLKKFDIFYVFPGFVTCLMALLLKSLIFIPITVYVNFIFTYMPWHYKIIPKQYILISFPTSILVSNQIRASLLFTCKVMAAQTDTKDRAKPLLG